MVCSLEAAREEGRSREEGGSRKWGLWRNARRRSGRNRSCSRWPRKVTFLSFFPRRNSPPSPSFLCPFLLSPLLTSHRRRRRRNVFFTFALLLLSLSPVLLDLPRLFLPPLSHDPSVVNPRENNEHTDPEPEGRVLRRGVGCEGVFEEGEEE
jgi:hypothetical protein